MSPLVVLESQQVVVAFLADKAAEDPSLVRFLVVEKGTRVPVTSTALVALVRAIIGYLPVVHTTAGLSTTSHAFGSIHVFVQCSTSCLAWTQVSDQVMAICKEHATVNANVVPSIHFAISIRAVAPQALYRSIRPVGSVGQLVIEQVLFSCEILAAGRAN